MSEAGKSESKWSGATDHSGWQSSPGGLPANLSRYSQDVMLLLFKKIKARKKSKYIKGSPHSPHCGSTNTQRVG